MNLSIKSVIKNPQNCCFHLKTFFHSTSFLEKGRRNSWNSRFNNYKSFGRYRKNRFKENVIKDTDAYVEYMFQSFESDFDRDEQPSNKGPSWFNRSNNGPKRNFRGQGHKNKGRRSFDFCEDDDDVETIFQSAFGDRFFYWSFVNEDYPNKGRRSSRKSNNFNASWRWKDQSEDEYEYAPEDSRKSNLSSERTALGLSASGPLKLEDVKNAYRASALKWHPDRHQGSSKADAEEKFKHCTAAYQSLCDSLAAN